MRKRAPGQVCDLKWSSQRRHNRRYDAQAATSSLAGWPLTSGCCGGAFGTLLPPLPSPDVRLGPPPLLLCLLLIGELAAAPAPESMTALLPGARAAAAG